MSPSRKTKEKRLKTATTLTHSGREPANQAGFVNPPVYRGSTVIYPTLQALKSNDQPYSYGRRATPTTNALSSAICELEKGAITFLTPSGLQAVSAAILAFIEGGDTILVADSVYQPTRKFCDRVLKRLGIRTVYYDPTIGADIEGLITKNTKLVFAESPGSLTFEVQDIPAIVGVAKQHKLWTILDNTWATPLFFDTLSHGVDVSILSATKYIVGHADAMLGAVTGNERAARQLNRIKEDMGICPGSEEVYLGLRGLRTLDVRLPRHQSSALMIANWLRERPEVQTVLHPALPDCPGHQIWKRDFTGSSGLFSALFKPVSESALAAFLDDLQFFAMGFSWGGYESLALPVDPRLTRSATNWKHAGHLVRFHIGLEDPVDLIDDLTAGFERLSKKS